MGGLAIFTLTGTVAPGATGLLPTRATSFPPVGIDDPQPASNSQADTDNLTLDVPELVHGFDETRALTATQDFFWITQQPFASYEVVVDATSGDIGDTNGPSLERMANDSTLTLQPSLPVGTGSSRSLRWRGPVTGAVVADQFVRVRSTTCTGDCGPDDLYRIRAYDTTYTVPRFNNSGTQVTVLFLQNPTTETVTGTMVFWTAAGGPVSTYGFNLPARQTLVLNTTTATSASGGSITIANDAPYAALAGKAVSVEPSTGFSFDTPLLPRSAVGGLLAALQVVDPHQHLDDVERLADEVLGAGLAARAACGGLGGHDEDRQVAVRLDLLQALHHLEPVHAGHLEVEQDQVVAVLAVELADLRAGPCVDATDGVAGAAQHALEQADVGSLVVDDQDPARRECRPSSTMSVRCACLIGLLGEGQRHVQRRP